MPDEVEPRFKLNRNPDRLDVLHVEHPYEECQTDDAISMTLVDALTAEALLVRGDAVACKHCQPGPVG